MEGVVGSIIGRLILGLIIGPAGSVGPAGQARHLVGHDNRHRSGGCNRRLTHRRRHWIWRHRGDRLDQALHPGRPGGSWSVRLYRQGGGFQHLKVE